MVGNGNGDLLTIKREIGREGGKKKKKEEREKGGRNEQKKRELQGIAGQQELDISNYKIAMEDSET